MANTTIKLKVDDENIVFTSSPPVFSGDVNTISAAFEFGANWDGLTKHAVFYRTIDNPYMVELTDDECLVPHEVMQTSGRMYIGVYGTADGKQKTSEVVFYDLGTGVLAGGMESGDTLALWQEILKKIDDIETISANIDAHVQQAVDAANTATAKATEASGYASTASQKATEATTSESNALQYKTDAETAKTQAESAKAGAESARDQAGTKVQEAIDNMTAEITAQINDALSPRIVESASGESVTVDDASGARLAGLKLYGKSVQDGTPTPEAPVPIESVSNPTVNVYGGNLLSNDSNYSVQPDNSVIEASNCVSSIVDVRKNKLFCLSGNFTLLNNSTARIGFFDEYPTEESVSMRRVTLNKAGENSGQISVNYNESWMIISLLANDNSSIDGIKQSFRLNLGESSLPYEPYTEQTLATALNLHAVPVTRGGNYTDESGQQWLSDVADFETGKVTRYTKKVTVDGENDIRQSESELNRFSVVLTELGVIANKVLCTRFVQATYGNLYPTRYGLCAISKGSVDGDIFVFVLADEVDTKQEGIDWCSQNPYDFIYVLATPTTEDIPAEVMQAYKAFHTNEGTTNVFTDTDAGIELRYVADTKLYIDKRIDAIASTLINSVTGE